MIFDRKGFSIRRERPMAYTVSREVRFIGRHRYFSDYEYIPWYIPRPKPPNAVIEILTHAPVGPREENSLLSIELTISWG